VASGNTQTALLLALESLRHAGEGIVNLENTGALWEVLSLPGEALHLTQGDIVWSANWNKNFSQILSFGGNAVHLWNASSGEHEQTFSHEDAAMSTTWNSDETQVLTTSRDGTARIWDAASGENLLTLQHDGAVWGASWSQDGSRIISLDNDDLDPAAFAGRARVWDATTGELIVTLPHPDLVRTVRLSRDGTRVLTSCYDGIARLWDVETGELLLELQHDWAVWLALFSPDESHILTSTLSLPDRGEVAGSEIKVWDAETGAEIVSLIDTDELAMPAPRWNAAGNRVLAASSDAEGRRIRVQVWDLEEGEVLRVEIVEDRNDNLMPQPQAIWNADESQILSWSGQTLRAWDAETGELLSTMAHQETIFGAAWSQDGTRVLAWDSGGFGAGTIRVWDVAGQTPLITLAHEAAVNGARWNEDESSILSWSYDGTVRVWNAGNPALLLHLTYETPWGGAVWKPDGRQLASWSGPTAAVWDPDSGEKLWTIEHQGETVSGITWNRDGSRLLSWGRDGTARLWDTSDGREIWRLPHDDVLLDAQWDSNEERLLTRTLAGKVHLWDLSTQAEIFPALSLFPDGLGQMLLNPGGQSFLTWASGDAALQLRDASNGEALQTIPREGGYGQAAWDATGGRLLDWSETGDLRIWDLETGTELRLSGASGPEASPLRGAGWNSSFSRVAAWDYDGTVRIWEASSGALLDEIENCGWDARWSADESLLLCAFNQPPDSAVKIWDFAAEEFRQSIPMLGEVAGAAWNADESRVMAWDQSGTTYVWIADIQELVEIASTRRYRELTPAEREQFFLPPAEPD
jgi:WD40 repeat protein